MSAEVKIVKGVQFNFVNFVWKEVAYIREKERDGNYALALEVACSLIDYLPIAFKKSMQPEADNHLKTMENLRQNVKGMDTFTRHIVAQRTLQNYARINLQKFMRELSDFLDKSGYMEKRDDTAEGYSHTVR